MALNALTKQEISWQRIVVQKYLTAKDKDFKYRTAKNRSSDVTHTCTCTCAAVGMNGNTTGSDGCLDSDNSEDDRGANRLSGLLFLGCMSNSCDCVLRVSVPVSVTKS